MNEYSCPSQPSAPSWGYQPLTPEQEEKQQLRRDGNYIGGLLLAQTAAMNFTFVAVTFLLVLMGVLEFSQLSQPTLGLSNTVFLLIYCGVYTFAMGIVAMVVSSCCRRKLFPFGKAAGLNAVDSFLAVLAAMGFCILANYAASYIMSFLMQFGIEMPQMPQYMEKTVTSLLLNILSTAVLPAFFEELVFRGYILCTLRRYGDWFAVIASALIFGAVHGNVLQVPFALLVGVLLGWLYIATENIWLPVAVHFCNNFFSILLEYGSLGMNETVQNSLYMLCMMVVLAVGGMALAVLIARRSELLRKWPKKQQLLSVGGHVSGLLRAPALVIAVVILLLQIVVEALT